MSTVATHYIQENNNCIVKISEWIFEKDMFFYKISANRFLHHMVRMLVGTMIEVAKNNMSISTFFLSETIFCSQTIFFGAIFFKPQVRNVKHPFLRVLSSGSHDGDRGGGYNLSFP